MKTTRHQIAAVIAELLLKKPIGRAALVQELAAYLLSENRLSELEPLLRDIVSYRAEDGVVEATTRSVYQLSDKDLVDIKSLTHQVRSKVSKVIINEQHDPTVVGGVRVEIVNQQLDLTVQAQLGRLKRLTSLERLGS
jgi:F0F1-type ATP synthase delta subunit